MTNKKYKPKHIPKRMLDAFIVECIDNAERFVKIAPSIAQIDVYAAAILLSFGVEEYGKSLCLRDYRNYQEDIIEVNGAIFKDHGIKLKKAEENLPVGTLILKPPAFQSDVFDTATTELNLGTRLDQLYVNWDEKSQSSSALPYVEIDRLQQCARTVSEHLGRLKQEIMNA